jgi:mannose-1-phosphate guanylyltransferase
MDAGRQEDASMIGRVRLLHQHDGISVRSSHLWGVVLSGGSASLLPRTVEHAATLIPRRRIVTVTARPHGGPGVAFAHVQRVVQPAYRGSAAEIFLPVLKIARRDGHATVVVLPGDLVTDHEARLMSYAKRAISAVELRPDVPVLLGARPHTPDPRHGWIEPGAPVDGLERLAVRTIARFIERPSRAEIGALCEGNGLRNTRIVIARAQTLIEIGKRCLPDVLETLEPLEAAFGRPEEPLLCDALYECMPRANLWRALLHGGDVAVLAIPDVMGRRHAPPMLQALAS